MKKNVLNKKKFTFKKIYFGEHNKEVKSNIEIFHKQMILISSSLPFSLRR